MITVSLWHEWVIDLAKEVAVEYEQYGRFRK